MHPLFVRMCGVFAVGSLAIAALTARSDAQGPNGDFGAFIADQLRSHSEQLFGCSHPLEESAIGPFDGNSEDALELADGLRASDTSSEPTGFIFLGSGEEAFVSLQHRAVDESGNRGTILKISAFTVR